MNIIRRIVMGIAGVVVVALALELAAPKAVHAVVSTLVTVSNSTAQPVPTMAVDTRNVNVVNTPNVSATISGTPSVNVNSMPPVTASIGGNVPVVNPLDGSGNPVPLGIQSDESSPVEATCQQNFAAGYAIAECEPYAVPSGQRLVIDDVSVFAALSTGQPTGGIGMFFPTLGSTVVFPVAFEPQGLNAGLNFFVAVQRTHLYSIGSEPITCSVSASTSQTSSALMGCTIVGHLAPAH